ncbi:MAG: abortive phage infection protein [Lachnospiraceae bacterium]|nr:abortive phage infection protein [Lachnospiraceae bacterium]MBD5510877.1 abortive phage infection protein [Lachnospiraceae bacterium]MBD5534733.1 abortive phage infection protein [Lachnospiraceae bacterium]MDE6063524.1 AbiEi antitoxin N-terminal domain-containing protein [Lachnospiraceae bacterium]
MNKNDVLQQLIEKNNGYLLSAMANENNISKTFLAKYVKEKGLERIAKGIYITEDVWPDELYIMQVRNKAVIFSGETALYLHGLIDREYSEICVSVPTGYNATHLKTGNVQVKYASKNSYGLGVCAVPSISGNMVRVYDRERCICDLISNRNKIEVQNFQTAMKEYMLGKGKKLSRLIEYAEKLGMRDEVMKYVEVFG